MPRQRSQLPSDQQPGQPSSPKGWERVTRLKQIGYMAVLTGAVTLATIVPVQGRTLVSHLIIASQNLAQAVPQALQAKPDVTLVLQAEKKITQGTNDNSEPSWQALAGQAMVVPGDVLRYTVRGHNQGNAPAQNLVVTQPIPQGMAYQAKTATTIGGEALITYSIDGGQVFSANPSIQLVLQDGSIEARPAPAEAYTHVRWQFRTTLAPQAEVLAQYEVRVR